MSSPSNIHLGQRHASDLVKHMVSWAWSFNNLIKHMVFWYPEAPGLSKNHVFLKEGGHGLVICDGARANCDANLFQGLEQFEADPGTIWGRPWNNLRQTLEQIVPDPATMQTPLKSGLFLAFVPDPGTICDRPGNNLRQTLEQFATDPGTICDRPGNKKTNL
jgi:hypothetical protein